MRPSKETGRGRLRGNYRARGLISTPAIAGERRRHRIALSGAHFRLGPARQRYAFDQERSLEAAWNRASRHLYDALFSRQARTGSSLVEDNGFRAPQPQVRVWLWRTLGGGVTEVTRAAGGGTQSRPLVCSVPPLDVTRRVPRSTGHWRLRGSVRGDGIHRRSYPYSSARGDGSLKALEVGAGTHGGKPCRPGMTNLA
jgi:hypothetical protein